jgi:hypothetical protein
VLFADRLTIGDRRRTKEGYLAVRARAARAGIYDYLGREVDPEGKHFRTDQVVKVYRPETEVFAKDSVHSFMLKPITDNHPTKPVTAENWDGIAKGVNAGAMRDGEYLAFDLVFMDKGIIQAIDGGKRELSNGYASEIEIADGETEDGQHYDAIQRNIRGNHVAVVEKGRAGPMCRIADEALCDSIPVELLERLLGDERTYSANPNDNKNEPARRETDNSGGSQVATKTITFDGLPLEVTDAAEMAITKLQNQLKDVNAAKDKAEGQVATLTTDKATLEAKVTTLEQQVKDAKLSPAQLRDAAKAFANTLDTAKKLAPNATINDSMDEAAIKRAVVSAKLGDAAKDWTDEQVAVSFDTLAAQSKDSQVDPVRNALSGGVVNTADARGEYDKARDAQKARLSDAWKQPAPAANADA